MKKLLISAAIGLLLLVGAAAWYTRLPAPAAERDPSSEPALIRIKSPLAGETIPNPVTVRGEARGYWFFEASAPVVVVNWDGLIIGEGYVMTESEWMTEDFVPFSGTISYDLPADTYSKNGTVIFMRDNPSGLPENDTAVEIPVVFE